MVVKGQKGLPEDIGGIGEGRKKGGGSFEKEVTNNRYTKAINT